MRRGGRLRAWPTGLCKERWKIRHAQIPTNFRRAEAEPRCALRQQFGLASAVSTVIFLIVAAITLVQMRSTRIAADEARQ